MPTREQLEELLAAEPDDVFLNFGLAMALAREGEQEAALRRFARVTELDADYAAAYYQRGRLLLELKRVDEARQVLTAGVAAARRSGDAHAETEMVDLLNLAC